jgi:Sortase domain
MASRVVISLVAVATLVGATFSPQSLTVAPARADDGLVTVAAVVRQGPMPIGSGVDPVAPPVAGPDALAAALDVNPAKKKVGVVARWITIPRLHIKLRILQGGGKVKALPHYAYHYPTTGWPGSGRATYLYGHARAGTFIALWRARIGDRITLTLKNGKNVRYKVYKILRKVKWSDRTWMYKSGEILVLQTCVGRNPKGPRFDVIARRV